MDIIYSFIKCLFFQVIVVDWESNTTKYHPDNVLQIPRWKGNDDDITLIHLSAFLLGKILKQIIKYNLINLQLFLKIKSMMSEM